MELKLTKTGERRLGSISKKINSGTIEPGTDLEDWRTLSMISIESSGGKSGSEQIMDIIERPVSTGEEAFDEEALSDSVEARRTVRRLFEAGYIEQV